MFAGAKVARIEILRKTRRQRGTLGDFILSRRTSLVDLRVDDVEQRNRNCFLVALIEAAGEKIINGLDV